LESELFTTKYSDLRGTHTESEDINIIILP